MRIEYSRDGTPKPIFEIGDYVRILRDDRRAPIAFRAGEWGSVIQIGAVTTDIQLAGYSRPRLATMSLARGVPTTWLAPCDRDGLLITLRQRDINRDGLRSEKYQDKSAMQIDYRRKGHPTPIFEVGDLVRLRRDELGEIVTAKAGEWGAVVRVDGGMLDIKLAGYSRPRTATMPMAQSIPSHIVDPCDTNGRVIVIEDDLKRRRWR